MNICLHHYEISVLTEQLLEFQDEPTRQYVFIRATPCRPLFRQNPSKVFAQRVE